MEYYDAKETTMEKKEYFTIESFWKEALNADSLLWWIVFNIGHNREE